jgi:hypothetical protein
MKKFMLGSALAMALATGCGEPTGPNPNPTDETKLGGVINQDRTLRSGQTYTLTEPTFVANAVLTIESGVKIVGERGSALVITSTARIEASGTAQAPIVFTSAQGEGQRAAGDWGGVVLLGRAPINVVGGREFIEGFQASDDPQRSTEYGGADAAHNCGTLKYVRIEFAGFELAPDNELNGLTLAGCGTGTTVDYVQSHLGSDDGVEIFGGTVNVKHVLITGADDDSLDWDLGYTGNIQYLIIQQHPNRGDNAIEADSNGEAPNQLPVSRPTLWNATLVGTSSPQNPIGLFLREGTGGFFHNFIITHFGTGAVDVIDADTSRRFPNDLAIRNSIFFANGAVPSGGGARPDLPNRPNSGHTFSENEQFLAQAYANRTGDPKLERALDAASPNFKPLADSSALSVDSAGTPPGGFFDTSARFVGAMGTTDWTAGWTAYPAN